MHAKDIPALVLAGGLSSRMGEEKANVMLAGKSLLEHCVKAISPQCSTIVLNAPADSAIMDADDLARIEDITPARLGPLSGILTGMDYFSRKSEAPYFLSVSVDCPFLPLDLTAKLHAALAGDNSIAMASSQGAMHPTIALWPVALKDALENWLARNEHHSVRGFLKSSAHQLVEFEPIEVGGQLIDPFFNINTKQDLDLAQKLLM